MIRLLLRICSRPSGIAALILMGLAVPCAEAQDPAGSEVIRFRVARSVALKAEPRFDSGSIRILEAGTFLRGLLLEDGEWWQASYGRLRGYVRDSAVDTTGPLGPAVVDARRRTAERVAISTRTTLRDSLRALVADRRARREFYEMTAEAHSEAVDELLSRGIYVSLLTARFRPDRRLSRRERKMMELEEEEWARHCAVQGIEACGALPGAAWGYVLSLENLHDSPIDSVWFELISIDEDGEVLETDLFQGIGPVGEGVPGGFWLFEPRALPRRTVCVELAELEVSWQDGLLLSYAGEDLRMARRLLVARGWPVLDAGPVGVRYAERSRMAFGLNEIVLEGDCFVR